MVRERKKGEKGHASKYIDRTRVVRRLQLTLPEFRKLCILKGIYPREPPKHFHGQKLHRTYYHVKDIAFLERDPLMENFRKFRTFKRKIRRHVAKHEDASVRALRKHSKPEYRLDHLVKERYPSFIDALRDLDDALCMAALFSHHQQTIKVHQARIFRCDRLMREWHAYIAATHTLRKVFVTIKGIYYQVTIMGQRITWVEPHHYSVKVARDVDYRVMVTFSEFYQTLLGFVLYRLYTGAGLAYPPVLDVRKDAAGEHTTSLILAPKAPAPLPAPVTNTQPQAQPIAQAKATPAATAPTATATPAPSAEQKKQQKKEGEKKKKEEDEEELAPPEPVVMVPSVPRPKHLLFSGCRFFLDREVPFRSLEFVITAYGGEVSWEGMLSPFPRTDTTITHEIVDREYSAHRYLYREYVQPQWLYDSVNEKVLLPVHEYAPGKPLPVHLSPFVDDSRRGYIPERRVELDKYRNIAFSSLAQSKAKAKTKEVEAPVDAIIMPAAGTTLLPAVPEVALKLPQFVRKKRQLPVSSATKETEQRAMMVMPSKKRRLYNRVKGRQQDRKKGVTQLERRRDEIRRAKETKGAK
eukprot:TRINITY_DN17555_c0_g1_i1.p1 TRINITY_DN17555_c0_g1~~TRINITY_DN17555_c0_g1_i1.p1  ORF type:complete len:593 (+),score=179.02 TRINITY_DN17555_c0_g1_i1:37-1779(+)